MSSSGVSLFEDPRHDLVTAFLLQVLCTLILCKVLAKILSFIHQPAVIGQIFAGIILGPSALGFVPGFSAFVFAPHTLISFQLVASLGLIFFMFYLGLKLDPNEIRQGWRRTLPIAFVSIIFPVGIGCAAGLWLYAMDMPNVSKISFILFVGSGIGFSAFPVLASILQAANLITTSIGVLTISIAAIEDIAVWVILAVASALSKGGPTIQGLYTLLLTGAFVFIMFIIIRPLLALLHGYYYRRNDEYNVYLIVVCLLVLVAASLASEVIKIHAFFGAFLAGLIIPRHQKGAKLHEFLAVRIELFIIEFFLPLYFTNSGLKTHVYLLNTGRAWYTLVGIIFIASIAKVVPVTLMTKLVTRKKETWFYALAVGILMNTRGIVQLVVLNIGVELGVLSPVIFAIFVMAAVIMTFATSPLLYLVYLRHQKPVVDQKPFQKIPQRRRLIQSSPTQENHLYINPVEQVIEKRHKKWRLAAPSS